MITLNKKQREIVEDIIAILIKKGEINEQKDLTFGKYGGVRMSEMIFELIYYEFIDYHKIKDKDLPLKSFEIALNYMFFKNYWFFSKNRNINGKNKRNFILKSSCTCYNINSLFIVRKFMINYR